MIIFETLTAKTIGALHNDLINRYLRDEPQRIKAITPAVMSSTVDQLVDYLIEAGFDARSVTQAAQAIKPELLRADLYQRGALLPPAKFIPILIEDAIQRANVSNELAIVLRQMSQLDTTQNGNFEANRTDTSAKFLSSSQEEQMFVDIFVSVAEASNDLWFGGAQARRGPTRDSQLIISDAVGALIGSVLSPLGAVLAGAALSIAVSETTR